MKHLQGFIDFDNFPNGVEVSSITDFYKLIVGYCAHLNFFKSSRSDLSVKTRKLTLSLTFRLTLCKKHVIMFPN